MEPFATYEDLVAGWPEAEARLGEEVACTLLLRATAQLSALLRRHGVAVDPEDEVQALNLAGAVCSMVRSSAAPLSDGISSMQQTVGSTSASVQWSNPDGSFFLSRYWRDVLGLTSPGGARALMYGTAFDGEGD